MSSEEPAAEPVVPSPASSPVPRPPSPDNCAICLSGINNKSFTDSCFHTFCFRCLRSWSKIRPECPLCKQGFKSIYYNIRTDSDYDEYSVRRSIETSSAEPSTSAATSTGPSTSTPTFGRLTIDYFAPVSRPFFSYPTTSGSSRRGNRSAAVPSSSHVLDITTPPPVSNTFVLPNMLPGIPRSNMSANERHVRYVKREEVYRYMLNSLPPEDQSRIRDCTPEFYAQNEAQVHRLAPWIMRELKAIRGLMPGVNVKAGLKEILRQLPRVNIQSNDFYQAIFPYTQVYTGKFVHELYLFARSPYDMYGYDAATAYEVFWNLPVATTLDPQRPPRRRLRNLPFRRRGTDDDDDDDDDDVRVVSPLRALCPSPERNNTNQRRDNRCRRNRVRRFGEFPVPSVNDNGTEVLSVSSDQSANALNTNPRPTFTIDISFDSGDNAASGQNVHGSNRDSDDECVIVEPPARRDVIVISDTEEEARRNAQLPSPLYVQPSPSRENSPITLDSSSPELPRFNDGHSSASGEVPNSNTDQVQNRKRKLNIIIEKRKSVEICTRRTKRSFPDYLKIVPGTSRTDFKPFSLSRQRSRSSYLPYNPLKTNRSRERSTSRELSKPEVITSTPKRRSLGLIKKTPCKNDDNSELSSSSNSSPEPAKQQKSTRKKDHSLKFSENDDVSGVEKHGQSLRSILKKPCKNDGTSEMLCSSYETNSSPGPSGSCAKQQKSTRKKDSLKSSENDDVSGVELKSKKHENSSDKKQPPLCSGPAGNLRSSKRNLPICSTAVEKGEEEDIPDNDSLVSSSTGRSMKSKTKPKKGTFPPRRGILRSADPFYDAIRSRNLDGVGRSAQNLRTSNSFFLEYGEDPFRWSLRSDPWPGKGLLTRIGLDNSHTPNANNEFDSSAQMTPASSFQGITSSAGEINVPEYGRCPYEGLTSFELPRRMKPRCDTPPATLSPTVSDEDESSNDNNAHHEN